ncbi:MAG TPA: RNA methyltransferase [Bacteriovoracaceae bacterium]|nr:RNA methyltransferase [Bacteriovoracaceae bacterium]
MEKINSKLYLGLVHYPINNKRGNTVTTSVTNMDIHDIARSCKSFGVEKYFIITPLKIQHELVSRILGHWEEDKAAAYNPDRQNALSVAQLSFSVEEAIAAISVANGGTPPIVVVTGANFSSFDGAASDLRQKMEIDKGPYLLLFGTGWGLHASLINQADYRLRPITGPVSDNYNHLSVRSAVAIYLDRLRGGL